MKHRLRFLVLIGASLVLAPSLFVFTSGKAPWAVQPIYQSSKGALGVLVSWWFISEIILHSKPPKSIAVILNVSMCASFLSVFVYLTVAVFSAGHRDQQTWHLLPIFTVMYQMLSIVASCTLTALIIGIMALRKQYGGNTAA